MSTAHSSVDQYCISHKTISYQAVAAPGPEVRRECPMTSFPALPLLATNPGDAIGTFRTRSMPKCVCHRGSAPDPTEEACIILPPSSVVPVVKVSLCWYHGSLAGQTFFCKQNRNTAYFNTVYRRDLLNLTFIYVHNIYDKAYSVHTQFNNMLNSQNELSIV